jgi:3-mercaptopyruvate sulfurtransferase SseA
MFIIVESPFRGKNRFERKVNLAYAAKCCYHVYEQGHIPFASHLFFPEFLDEDDPKERAAGIEAGYYFWSIADEVWFFVYREWSKGMTMALTKVRAENKPYQILNLPQY